ncbi:MAG: ABC transporter ATP-binding protein [Lachnospiraceae bacterium]|nr:ABC transporter ATP-binding protein [Lachnospiraceae bacterium]
MSDTVVRFEDVTKIYKLYDSPKDRFKETFSLRNKRYSKDFYALDKMSFALERGETIGIVGKNGSGKSTLLKILTGVLSQTSGKVEVNGKISALLELGAGFNMEFTGIENIYLNGTILDIPKEEMDKRLESIISFADIGGFINQPVKTYSSGMFVRLAFAVAIHVDPEILIVDEALAVGDTRFQMKCMDKFIEFMNAGKTVIIVSHDLNMIKRFCKRAIWINDGKMVMDGETDPVTDKYNDFLKSGLPFEEYMSMISLDGEASDKASTGDGPNATDGEGNTAGTSKEEAAANANGVIAEVKDVRLLNEQGEEINEIPFGQDVTVVVDYDVHEENVNEPVLGIAIRSIDHNYICGLNTLLDSKKIPWKKGSNTYKLTYERFNLTGGNYYFDVALFDKTATVNFDYRSQAKKFFVKMDYVAEGITVLHHKWSM